ncbi:YDR319C [Saccharomyces arboricola H-6]|uniref:Acyl-coenzyme A diphosphatase YFT2 n=1 Tax=Saccharomyces arboricola (strain H-6 / AS 2.3317 / CBS 10644) TaxID=1160507 RepID=J8PJJ4_SACAR|nr:YDR319C [Saccharomyces arboricola H-6]
MIRQLYYYSRKAYLVYPIQVLIGAIITILVSTETLDYQKKTYALLKSSNFLNKIFAYKANQLWPFLFFSLSFLQIYFHYLARLDVLPLPISSSGAGPIHLSYTNVWSLLKNRVIITMVAQYGCKFILKDLLLFLCFQFIDHVFVWTGGECTSGSGTTSAEKCHLEEGEWHGGFDISGHFCFLVNISMILWMELHLFSRFVQTEDMFWVVNKWVRACLAIICAVLVIWICILWVTSIYYHTVLEKILGCLMGYICPIFIYYILPKIKGLHDYIYI